MSSPLPDRQLLVALRNGPLDDLTTFVVDAPGVAPAAGHWTDISAYAPGLSSYQIDRGVQHDLGQGVAATLKVGLRNEGGEFNPWIPSNGVTAGLFAPYLAGPRDGGTINAYGGLKLPVQVRDLVRGAQLLSPGQRNPGDTSGWVPGGVAVLSAASGVLTTTASGAGQMYVRTLSIAGAPGYTYTVTATFATAVTARTVDIILTYYGVSGFISEDVVSGVDSVGGVTLTHTGTSPAGTTNVVVQLDVYSAAGGEVHSFSNMSLTGPAISYAFTGHATAWRPLWSGPVSTWAELEASDAFRYFNDLQLGNQAYTAAVPSTASHYWRIGEPAGAVSLADSIGGIPAVVKVAASGSAATLGGAGALLLNSLGSGCIQFPSTSGGAGPWLNMAGAGFGGAGAWTVMLWVRNDGLTTGVGVNIVSQNDSPVNNNSWDLFALLFTGLGVGLAVEAKDGAGTRRVTPAVLIPQDNNFHHVAVTFDGSTLILYFDGQSVGSVATGLSLSSAADFVAGANNAAGLNAYGGFSLSEVSLHGGALTATLVNTFFVSGVGFVGQSTGQRTRAALALIGWPANLELLDAGVQQCQQNTQNLTTTTLLTHLQDVESTEEGALFITGGGSVRSVSRQNLATQAPFAVTQCWFGDEIPVPAGNGWDVGAWDVDFTWGTLDVPFDPGTDPVLDDTDHTTGATVTRVGGLAQTVGSGVSTRVRSVSGVLHTTDAGSLAHANWITAKDGVPVARLAQIKIDLTEFLGDPDAVARVLAARELLTRVNAERTEVGFAEVGLVEHTSETTTADSWDITISLSTTDTFAGWGWGGAQ